MTQASGSPVSYDVSSGVATITLTRPESMNSMTRAAKVALRDAVQAAAADSMVRAVVVTGSGGVFCVGQDLREHVEDLARGQAELWSTIPEHFAPIATALATMPKPVVAAVNGVAAGAGASIAFACDFRLVAESAGFNTAFAGIALSCDTGAAYTLPRLVGQARAVELLMMPRTVKAPEALQMGLATQVTPDAALPDAVAAFAARLASGPTLAYAAIKRSVAFAATHDLAETMVYEAQKMALTGATQDHADAVAAFLAKQRPVFNGR
ncbi:MAG: enoyl-CoA hydratase-related protein [Actinomycetota bacterium]|nr:enoyl-CoA hydratase-related protein [Actinomycetota bacterium]